MKRIQLSCTLCLFLIFFTTCHEVQSSDILLIKKSSKKSLDICEQFFNVTNCYYFACIDSIYQCGSENLLVQFSYTMCEATLERAYNSLTRPGQIWAKTAQTCVMEELHYMLKTKSSLTCTQIDRYTLNKYPICLTQSHPFLSLCSIICNNLEIFIEIFDDWTLKNLNLKRLLLETSRLCQEQSQMEYVIDIKQSSIRTILWSLCLDAFKVKFKNFHPNQLMIKTNQRLGGMFSNRIEEEKN